MTEQNEPPCQTGEEKAGRDVNDAGRDVNSAERDVNNVSVTGDSATISFTDSRRTTNNSGPTFYNDFGPDSASTSDDKASIKPEDGGGDGTTRPAPPPEAEEATYTRRFGAAILQGATIHAHIGAEDSEPLQDPTEEMRPLSPGKYSPKAEEVDRFAKILLAERCLVVASRDEDSVSSVLHALIHHPAVSGHQLRTFRRSPRCELGDDIDLKALGRLPKFGDGRPALIVNDARDGELAGVIATSETSFASLHTTLTSRKMLLLFGNIGRLGRMPKGLAVWSIEGLAAGADGTTSPAELLDKEVQPEELSLYLAAYYVAAYFPTISVSDFEALMKLLLDGEAIEQRQTSTITDQAGSRTVEAKVSVSAQAVWEQRGSRILQELRIHLRTAGDGRKILGLHDLATIEAATAMFDSRYPLFRERMFGRLVDHHILIRPDVSASLAKQAVQVFIAEMHADSEHRTGILDRMLDWLGQEISEHLERRAQLRTVLKMGVERNLGLDTFFASLKAMFVGPGPELAEHDQLVARVAHLFTALDEEPKLRNMGWRILDEVEAKGYSQFVCDIMLAAANERSYTPSSEFWEKLRKWYDSNRDEVLRSSYYSFLIRYIARRQHDPFVALDVLFTWLPRSEKDPLLPSGEAALRLLHDYAFHVNSATDRADYGTWPPAMRLLADMAGEGADGRRRRIVEWVFHPAWKRLTRPLSPVDADSPPANPETLNSDLITVMFVGWLLRLLARPNGQPVNPLAVDLAQSLAAHVNARLDRVQRSDLRNLMMSFRSDLNTTRQQLPRNDRKWVDCLRLALSDAMTIIFGRKASAGS